QKLAKIERDTYRRLQTSATPPEIWSGKSLNALLNGLKKYANQKLPVSSGPLDEDILKHINVTSKYGNFGLLRNLDPRRPTLPWPSVLRDPTLIPSDERKELESETGRLVKLAMSGAPVESAALSALQGKIDDIRDRLTKNVNTIPTQQYMEAKRFLNDYDESLRALRDGDAAAYSQFVAFAGEGKRTVQDLVDYMARKGLRFAPSISGDEAAYQAVHNALVGWSVALENQVASAGKE